MVIFYLCTRWLTQPHYSATREVLKCKHMKKQKFRKFIEVTQKKNWGTPRGFSIFFQKIGTSGNILRSPKKIQIRSSKNFANEISLISFANSIYLRNPLNFIFDDKGTKNRQANKQTHK